MTAQALFALHRPAFLHDADTLLVMHYPGIRITRKRIFVEGRIAVGWRYCLKHRWYRREEAELYVGGLKPNT